MTLLVGDTPHAVFVDQQVDFEVEQVRHGEEHRFLDPALGVGVAKEVHGPVGVAVVHLDSPGMAPSSRTHSAADSLLIGATARFATNANRTRSMFVVNRRLW
jgi:hypothetical protein